MNLQSNGRVLMILGTRMGISTFRFFRIIYKSPFFPIAEIMSNDSDNENQKTPKSSMLRARMNCEEQNIYEYSPWLRNLVLFERIGILRFDYV